MTLEGRKRLAGNVPEAGGFVPAGAGDDIAGRRERDRTDHPGVSLERGALGAGRGIPQLDGLVPTGGGDQLAVGGERKPGDVARVASRRFVGERCRFGVLHLTILGRQQRLRVQNRRHCWRRRRCRYRRKRRGNRSRRLFHRNHRDFGIGGRQGGRIMGDDHRPLALARNIGGEGWRDVRRSLGRSHGGGDAAQRDRARVIVGLEVSGVGAHVARLFRIRKEIRVGIGGGHGRGRRFGTGFSAFFGQIESNHTTE